MVRQYKKRRDTTYPYIFIAKLRDLQIADSLQRHVLFMLLRSFRRCFGTKVFKASSEIVAIGRLLIEAIVPFSTRISSSERDMPCLIMQLVQYNNKKRIFSVSTEEICFNIDIRRSLFVLFVNRL